MFWIAYGTCAGRRRDVFSVAGAENVRVRGVVRPNAEKNIVSLCEPIDIFSASAYNPSVDVRNGELASERSVTAGTKSKAAWSRVISADVFAMANLKERRDMTSSMLAYLTAVRQLGSEGGRVRSVDIAERLGVARASVSKALDRLWEAGYAARTEDGGVRLTEKGGEVVELYSKALVKVKGCLVGLGVGEARAEKEALAALGALDEDTVKRIVRLG